MCRLVSPHPLAPLICNAYAWWVLFIVKLYRSQRELGAKLGGAMGRHSYMGPLLRDYSNIFINACIMLVFRNKVLGQGYSNTKSI